MTWRMLLMGGLLLCGGCGSDEPTPPLMLSGTVRAVQEDGLLVNVTLSVAPHDVPCDLQAPAGLALLRAQATEFKRLGAEFAELADRVEEQQQAAAAAEAPLPPGEGGD